MKIKELTDFGKLYHGTSRLEFNKLKNSNYHATNFYVGDHIDNICWYYAEQASKKDGSNPVIITLDKNKLENIADVVDDYHLGDDLEEIIQAGQFIANGNIKDSILAATEFDEDDEEIKLEI